MVASGQYLTFTLGRDTLALGILGIREILAYRDPTPVQRAPAHIRGVINLRGAVVPVLDLAVRLGRPTAQRGRKSCILVVEIRFKDEPHALGVIVDGVSEVMMIDSAQVERPPSFGGTIEAHYLEGLAQVRGRFVALLDPPSVFNLGELAAPA